MKTLSREPGLRSLTFQDIQTLEKYLGYQARELSAYAPAAHWIWRDFFSYHWTLLDGFFCLFAQCEGHYHMPLPPLGSGLKISVIRECFELMARLNRNPVFSRIENVDEQTARKLEAEGFKLQAGGQEYLYRSDRLAGLRGDAYKSKRWAVNRFLSRHTPEYGPYQSTDMAPCLALFERWKASREERVSDAYFRALLEDSSLAHRRVLAGEQGLKLLGRVVRVKDQVVAYTFGYFLQEQVFCVLLEVAEPELNGLAQFIFWKLCSELEKTKYINSLDDSGLEGLRRVKMSYRPERLICAWRISLSA